MTLPNQDDRDRDLALTPVFRALNTADDGMTASPEVEARLRREVLAIARARRARYAALWLAAAAAVVVAVGIAFWRSDRSAGRDAGQPAVITVAAHDVTTDFFPLAYAYVPAFSTHIVRMEFPRRALASFGLGSFEIEADPTATVKADVVVGEDGLARYVRFVRPAQQ